MTVAARNTVEAITAERLDDHLITCPTPLVIGGSFTLSLQELRESVSRAPREGLSRDSPRRGDKEGGRSRGDAIARRPLSVLPDKIFSCRQVHESERLPNPSGTPIHLSGSCTSDRGKEARCSRST